MRVRLSLAPCLARAPACLHLSAQASPRLTEVSVGNIEPVPSTPKKMHGAAAPSWLRQLHVL